MQLGPTFDLLLGVAGFCELLIKVLLFLGKDYVELICVEDYGLSVGVWALSQNGRRRCASRCDCFRRVQLRAAVTTVLRLVTFILLVELLGEHLKSYYLVFDLRDLVVDQSPSDAELLYVCSRSFDGLTWLVVRALEHLLLALLQLS